MSELTTMNQHSSENGDTEKSELTESATNCCQADESRGDCCSSNEMTYESVRPSVDIAETTEAVILSADVPGADESTVDLEIEKGVLRLTAVASSTGPEWARNTSGRLRRYERTFRVSDDLDGHGAEASVANGVLTIRFPKRAEAVATKIAVRQAN